MHSTVSSRTQPTCPASCSASRRCRCRTARSSGRIRPNTVRIIAPSPSRLDPSRSIRRPDLRRRRACRGFGPGGAHHRVLIGRVDATPERFHLSSSVPSRWCTVRVCGCSGSPSGGTRCGAAGRRPRCSASAHRRAENSAAFPPRTGHVVEDLPHLNGSSPRCWGLDLLSGQRSETEA